MKLSSILTVVAITALAFSVGCGKMSGSGSSAAASQSTGGTSSPSNDFVNDTNQDIATFNQQNVALQQQIDNLNSQIDSISLTTLESGSTGAVAVAQARPGAQIRSLQSTIQGLLANVYNGVAALYSKVDGLQTKIQNDIAQLNLNDPAQIAEGAALEASLLYIQQAKTKLDTLVNSLETKVQGFVTSINTKLATLTASNPLYLIAELYWAQIEPLFTTFDTELTALTQ